MGLFGKDKKKDAPLALEAGDTLPPRDAEEGVACTRTHERAGEVDGLKDELSALAAKLQAKERDLDLVAHLETQLARQHESLKGYARSAGYLETLFSRAAKELDALYVESRQAGMPTHLLAEIARIRKVFVDAEDHVRASQQSQAERDSIGTAEQAHAVSRGAARGDAFSAYGVRGLLGG